MKVYGELEIIPPLILTLHNRRRQVVGFTLRQVYARNKPRRPLNMELFESQRWYGRGAKSIVSSGESNHDFPVDQAVT
jgi:hypothetical protein